MVVIVLPLNDIYWYYNITILKKVIPTGLSLPIELMRQIDSERGDIPRSRYVLRILEKQYTRETNDDTGSLDRRIETLQSSKPETIGGLNHGQ
jgi:hypothetical protein